MPDEVLRQFYKLAGKPLHAINEWRLASAASPGIHQEEIEAAIAKLLAIFDTEWATQISAVEDYTAREDEWRINCGVWRHGGQLGSEPSPPDWPSEIPQYEDAMTIVRDFIDLREQATCIERLFTDSGWLASTLDRLILWLDTLKELLEAPEDDESDGLIDRNKLAELLGIKPKTLANRADELPDPITRNARGVPVFRYRAVRLALMKMYPEKGFMLPENFGEFGQSN